MDIAQSKEVITHNVKQAVDLLTQQYSEWVAHVKAGDGLLYELLEGCLEFHNFLVSKDDYQVAFKGLCLFNWHRSTPLVVLVAKQVFGSRNKQVYDYIKALNAALAKGVGANGGIGMAQWLKENGGISGVVKANGNVSKAQIEREFRIHVAYNAAKFGLKDRLGSFICKEMAAGIVNASQDVVILATVDRKTGEFTPMLLCEDLGIRRTLWEMRGDAIMATPEYHRAKDTYLSDLAKKNAKTAAEVMNAFKKVPSAKKVQEQLDVISKVCEPA